MLLHHKQITTFPLVILVALLSGCYTQAAFTTDPATAEKILRASESNPAQVILDGDDAVVCYAVIIRHDSIRWQAVTTHAQKAVPSSRVNAVIVKNGSPGISTGGRCIAWTYSGRLDRSC